MTPNDVKIVADNIDDFIEVPDGVERLRKAVFTLAVSGKLVLQNKTDGTAEDLYGQIQKDRTKAKNNFTAPKRKTKDLAPISDDEIPFEIPELWKWVRLNEVSDINGGYAFKSQNFEDIGVRVIKISDFDEKGFKDNKIVRHEYDPSLSQYEIDNENILLCMTGGTVGKSYFVKNIKERMITNQRVATIKINRCVIPEYINHVILSSYIQKIISERKNSTNDNISMDDIKSFVVPLPPIGEQKRIVKKVEELMRQLDELEVKKRERDEVCTRLSRSAMQSLGKGESKIAFEHLAELIHTPVDLKELEGALLTLAVSGKLVPQDKKNGTSEELYKQIQSSIKSGAEGRKKKTVGLATISTKEVPFEIPKSWKWVRLAEIGKLDTGKTPRTGVTGNYSGDIPFVGPGDVQNGKINSYSKLITKQGASESKYLYPGDILMVCIGGTIGKTALVTGTHTFNQQINKITPYLVDSTFLFCVFQSGFFQKLVWSKASGGATPIVNLTRWSSCVVPLPPLAEQKRIVKKVEEVTVLINRLKQVIGEK